MVLINCHKCNRVMVDELGDGTLRIRTRILLARLNGTGVQAVCPQCKNYWSKLQIKKQLDSIRSGVPACAQHARGAPLFLERD
ncbi:hypothetical protein [Paenibacillus ehimensis]|uniref:Uncharacterized protein n=1 Tax=Paenibacillus ehimensis TaxID=79264 RepID=A0ABT8V5L5_9BACL|nr:hypothetical protein [Paenibacillus ehimensis]MDO3676723.1 hypothetical protein [Paenibacillus ehimensis]